MPIGDGSGGGDDDVGSASSVCLVPHKEIAFHMRISRASDCEMTQGLGWARLSLADCGSQQLWLPTSLTWSSWQKEQQCPTVQLRATAAASPVLVASVSELNIARQSK